MTMIATLSTFARALATPDLSLTTLRDARAELDDDGLPRLARSTRFAEARIEWRGRQWLLFLPLTPAALPRIERTASHLRQLVTPWLTEYRILPGELRWRDATGAERTADLVVQHLPAGETLSEAMARVPGERLLAALEALEAGLRELDFTHNNLKASNLRWTGDRLVPLRYHDAAFGAPHDTDTAAFEALRREIAAATGSEASQEAHDMQASYAAPLHLPGHRWTSHLFEGLVCVEDDSGYGYVDPENRPVIPAQFRWAGDFREGRAEVETPEGMGLIDRSGSYIIPPRYEIVDYDPATSVVRVRQDGRWALFDYLGRRLTEFGTVRELQDL